MGAIDVPYHYEHAPKVQQGVRVENSNNWYIGARRVASPIVVLTEAPAYNIDIPGARAPEWDVIPGGNWTALRAEPAPPNRPSGPLLKNSPSVQVVLPDEPNPEGELAGSPAAPGGLEVEVVSPWAESKPTPMHPTKPANGAPRGSENLSSSRVELPPPAPTPPEKYVDVPAVVPEPLDLPRGIFGGDGGEFVKEAFERDGVLPK